MEYNSFLVLIASALLGYFIYTWSKRNSKYPPGPIGIPIFGSFFSVGLAPHLTFAKWTKKYGSVFSVKIGNVNAVVLNDTKSIRDAFKEDTFTGRPANELFMQLAGGGKDGVAFSDGNIWVEQRRFALRALRDLGFGKNTMESIIMEEVDEFMEYLLKEAGNSISLNRRFSLAVLNSIWMIISGRRYKHDDPQLKAISDAGSETLNQAVSSGFLVFLHQLSAIAPELTGWKKFTGLMKVVVDMMWQEINEHDATFVEANPPRDFIDIYLANIKATTNPASTFYKNSGYKQLNAVLVDFYGAGSETTSATLTWAVLYLATNLKVQKKFQEELDSVVGKNRRPTLADKPRLPYTEAVMNEVLRMSSIVPSGLFHTTTRNVTFQGFEIPKDTYIIANLHGVHHDPDVWKDPENFRPERFLSNDEQTVLKHDSLLAFSVGKRACIGESLALNEFYLFLVNIFQRYEVIPDPASGEISREPILGFILQPKKFNVIMRDRFA